MNWKENETERSATFRSESGAPEPVRLATADDTTTADQALKRLARGEALLYQGDFRNAKQLLSAIGRRLTRATRLPTSTTLFERFRAERRDHAREAEVLGRLLVELDPSNKLKLASAPDVSLACTEAWGKKGKDSTLVSLRELLGILGAAEWRKKGVEVRALKRRIHPHYGVFSPTRQDYVELFLLAPEPRGKRVFDLGTGTGVLALMMAQRGATEVIATDIDPRCVACAKDNAERLKLTSKVHVEERDLFPSGKADIIVCNPPWLPEAPRTRIDRAIYDEGGTLLTRVLNEGPAHLNSGGELWLVISNLSELLGLRPEGGIAKEFEKAGWIVAWSHSAPPTHGKSKDAKDPLHAARSTELTTLYGLRRK